MARSADPTREVAMIALNGAASDNAALKQIIHYAFDQLCWRTDTGDLEKLLAELNAKLSEDA